MSQAPDNQDELQKSLQRLNDEFGQRGQPGQEPVYGEAQAIPQQQTVRLSLPIRPPRAIWVLLAINIIVFLVPKGLDLLGLSFSAQIPSKYFPELHPTNLLIPSDYLFTLGAKNNLAISQYGQYYRFLTSMFLHSGWLHITFNAYALYALGPEAERIYGTLRFLALYFIAGFAGGVLSYAFNPYNAVGASGAIFGLVGGLAAFYYISRGLLGEVSRQQLGNLISVVMINLFIGFSSSQIDNTAHIGGLLGGVAAGLILAPRFAVDQRVYPPVVVRRSWPLAWPAALALALALLGLVMIIQPPIQPIGG